MGRIKDSLQEEQGTQDKALALFLFGGFQLKLGHGTLTICSLFCLFTLPKFPCSWHDFLGLSVCCWLLCLPFASLGHHPSVLSQPSSSVHFSWASSKRPPPTPVAASGPGWTHLPFFISQFFLLSQITLPDENVDIMLVENGVWLLRFLHSTEI